jgi:hypothetical protein
MTMERTPVTGNDCLADAMPAPPSGGAGSRTLSWHWPTFAALLETIPEKRPADVWGSHCDGWDHDSFRGTPDMPAALALARDGWHEGADRARAMLDRLAVSRPVARKASRFAVAGSIPDVPRYLAGNPLNMRALAMAPTARAPIVTLVSDACAGYNVPPSKFEALAASLAAIVDRLEAAGFRVEVVAGFRTTSGAMTLEAAWLAKAAQDALDLPRFALAVGHPSMARRFAFAAFFMDRRAKPMGVGLGGVARLDRAPDRRGCFITPSPADMTGRDEADFDKTVAALRAQGCPGLAED